MFNVTRYDVNEDVETGELFISPVPENIEGPYVAYDDYAALQQELDAISAKALELCSEASCVYQKYNITQMPDKDLVDHQTIQELSDLIRSGTHDTADKAD